MSFLWVTIPVSLILAGVMLGLVIHGVRRGDFDDWEGPAARMVFDDDESPEIEGPGRDPEDGAST